MEQFTVARKPNFVIDLATYEALEELAKAARVYAGEWGPNTEDPTGQRIIAAVQSLDALETEAADRVGA